MMQRPVEPIGTERLEDEAREAMALVADRTGINDEHDGPVLAMTLPTGDLIGYVTLQITSREHEQGEIGYILHLDHRGHGYATEATRVMKRAGEGRADRRVDLRDAA